MRIRRFRQGLASPLLTTSLLTVACVIAPLTVRAQSPQTQTPPAPKASEVVKPAIETPLPGARSIINRHLEAIGGRAAILSHSSTRATGTFTMPSAGLTGTIEVMAAKPNKNVVKVKIGGVGEIVEAFDGTRGWSISPMSGPMLLEGKPLEDRQFDADYYADLHDDSRFLSMTTIEQTEFDGRQCYKVKLVRKNGSEDMEFFDVKTGLKAGRTATRETPMGAMTATHVETDYKKFGNLLVPTTIKNTIMGMQQVITIQTVEYDNVSASTFEPPAEIKALIK